MEQRGKGGWVRKTCQPEEAVLSLEMEDTKQQAGDLLCVWERGGASLLITHPPGTALSQSLRRLLLPLQLWGGDEAPVIHSLDRQLAPSGPLPPSQGAAQPASSSLHRAGLRPRQPPQCPGQQEPRAPVGRHFSLLFSLEPHTGQLSQWVGGLRRQRGSCLTSKVDLLQRRQLWLWSAGNLGTPFSF